MNEQKFLQRIDLSSEQIEEARLKTSDLLKIFEHHESNQDNLLRAGENIQRTLRTVQSVHSTRVRVKTPVSLIRKIVRKHIDDDKREITLENYRDDVRDLVVAQCGLFPAEIFRFEARASHRHQPRSKAKIAVERGWCPSLTTRVEPLPVI